jgi:hypothetical protein
LKVSSSSEENGFELKEGEYATFFLLFAAGKFKYKISSNLMSS